MFTKPEMLLHYAHWLRDRYAAEGKGKVRVYADVGKSVNGKPWRRFVDPDADLAAVDGMRWLGSEPWLLRPEPAQIAAAPLPDWYPPITGARLAAMMGAFARGARSRADETGEARE